MAAVSPPHCPVKPQRISETLLLEAIPVSPRTARKAARSWLTGWGTSEELIERSELIASELVTNAVLASKIYDAPPAIRFRMSARQGRALIEVWDCNPLLPVLRKPTADDEKWRGLPLVASLSRRWGFTPAYSGGKIVWAEVE
jgi:anti-sigma regulatory factor (Ser/Thr protein kinase)